MNTNIPPAKLNNRHHLLAYLLVAGKTDAEAAATLGYSPVRVGQIKKSPLFMALVGELRAEIAEKHVTNVAEWLENETQPTLRRMKELRDQDESLPVALGATVRMFDQISPKISKSESETVHRHVWDRRDIQAMAKVLAEDEGKAIEADDADFEPLALPEVAGSDEAVDAGVPTLDDLLEEYEGEER